MSEPTESLLASTHEFPLDYSFKIIGQTNLGFVERVVANVRDTLALATDPPFSIRETAGGRHVSVTIQAFVHTPQQVIAVYERLRPIEGLVMMM